MVLEVWLNPVTELGPWMTKFMKFGLVPAIIVLSIMAITVNIYYRLIKKPSQGEAVTIETERVQLPQPERMR